VVLVLATLIPTIVLGVTSAVLIREQAQQETIRGSLSVVRVVGFGVDATLQDARRAMETVAAMPDVADTPWDDEHAPELRRRLELLSGRFPLLSQLYLLDTRGQPVLATRSAGPMEALSGFSPELADNYGGYVSDVFPARHTGAPHIFMVVEVRDRALRKRGFLAATIDLANLHTALTDAIDPEQNQAGQLLIVDSHGRAIYPPSAWAASSENLRAQHPAVDRVLSTLSEGHVTFVDRDGQRWLAVYKSMIGYSRTRGIRWGIVLQRPAEEAFRSADIAARNTALIAIGCFVLALLVAFPMANVLTAALRELGRYALAIGRSEALTPHALPPSLAGRTDEVGALARAMSVMLADLQRSRSEIVGRHQALRKAERLSSVGLLAAGVAHEINNPLTTILGYGEFLLEDKDAAHEDRDALELIVSEAGRVREIVRGLLELSRRRGDLHPFDLRETVQRAETLARAGLNLGAIELETDLPETPVILDADPQAVLQVLMNFITNAVDAIDEAGGAGRVVVGCRGVGDEAVVWTEDTGGGMDAETLAQATEPFFTTKPSGKGTGLGLAVVTSIVEDHGGRLSIRSAPGEGTRIEVRLGLTARSSSDDRPSEA